MLKKLLVTGSSLLALAGIASAAQVAVDNFTNPFPITASGASIASGTGFVAIGSITGMSDADISGITMTRDVSGLDAAFSQFGDDLQFGASGFDGFFQGDIAEGILSDSAFVGQTIYLIAGDGADISSSAHLVVFKSATTLEQDNPLYSTEVKFDQDFTDEGLLLGERVAGVDVPGIGAFDGVAAAAIPEPSAFSLLGLGLAGLVLRRRR